MVVSEDVIPTTQLSGVDVNVDSLVNNSALALALSVEHPLATANPGLEVKKRKTRGQSGSTGLSLTDAAALTGEGGVGSENEDDEFSADEDEMSAVMAKIKEAAECQHKVPTGVPLYESKRMSRVSFNSWFEFDSYFEMYMQDTFQPFRMRSSCSVEAYRRNQNKVMMNNKHSRGRRVEFPDSAIHHHRIYMCTHAMKARCRGASTRPGQKYRGIGCVAKINVKISPSDGPSKYMVIVTDQVC